MPSVTRSNRAQRHLDVYEPWQQDHQDAMRCYKLEEWLNEGASVFGMIEFAFAAVRSGVRTGFIAGEDADVCLAEAMAQYARWLKTARSGDTAIAWCRTRFGEVKHADELGDCIRRAKEAMAAPSPKLALAVGARYDEMSEDEAEELRAILDKPPLTARREYCVLPDGDPSLLR